MAQAKALLSFAHHLCLQQLCHTGAVQGGHILYKDPQVFPTRLRSDPTHSTDAIHSPLLQRNTSAQLARYPGQLQPLKHIELLTSSLSTGSAHLSQSRRL